MTNRLKKITPFVEFPSKEIDEFEILETYFVDVKVKGEWKERYEVEAESEDDARDRWNDGEYVDSNNYMGNEREVIHVEKG